MKGRGWGNRGGKAASAGDQSIGNSVEALSSGRRTGRVKVAMVWKKLVWPAVLWVLLFNPEPVLCQDSKTDTEALIQLLRQKGVISDKEAREFLKRSTAQPAVQPETKAADNAELQEEVKRLREQLNRNAEDTMQRQRLSERKVDELQTKLSDINSKVFKSDWAQRIRFGGDIRLRYQGDYYDNNNGLLFDYNKLLANPNDIQLQNTTENRDRFRYRARLGMLASITDPQYTEAGKFEVGVRVSTGNEKDPVSTNDTFGDYYNKEGVVFDQVYLRYTYQPSDALLFNWIPRLTLTGGRIPNPFFHTDMVWDPDLGLEGFAVSLLTNSQEDARLRGFLTAGAFPLQEVELNSNDKWLYGIQIGMDAKPTAELAAKIGLAYYDYQNTVGKANSPAAPKENDWSAPLFLQKGNTLFNINSDVPGGGILPGLATDYNLVNLTTQFDYGRWHPIHVILTGDYVRNIGYDKSQVKKKTGESDVDKGTQGFQTGIQVGYPNIVNFAEWNILLAYKYLEADAVMDSFTDSDFHGGGTNAQGWIIGAGFGLYHNVWLTVRWMTADEVSGEPLSIDVLQVDVNARF
jgi:hypothetical protein